MGFSAAFSGDHSRLNPEAYAQPDQGAKEHRMTIRPTAFPWLLLTQGGRQVPTGPISRFTASRRIPVGN